MKAEASKLKHYWNTIRTLIAAIAVAALALGVPAAPSAQAAGLINCVDLSVMAGRSGACQESVWVNGVEYRMNFAQEAKEFPGARPNDPTYSFYVIAPQAGTPQGALPFAHDHVVPFAPIQNHGAYSVLLHGYLVFCNPQYTGSSVCVSDTDPVLVLAQSVDNHALTSVQSIEAAASAGVVVLFDTGATYLGIVNPGK